MSTIMADQALIADTDRVTEATKPQTTQQNQLINKLIYDGHTSQVYKIWLLNLLMNIITLGIYNFWGKTRLRKYVTASVSLLGDRFEYTGTGKELFIGFLKAIPIFIAVYGPFMVASYIAPEAAWPTMFLLPIFYLIPVAMYSALRYRMSRLRWRGIRCRLAGSPLKYANLFLWRGFLNAVSLGILLPYSDIKKYQYKVENSFYGDVPFTFKGNGKNLMIIHLATYALAIGLFFIVLLGMQLMSVSLPSTEFSPSAQDMSNNSPAHLFLTNSVFIAATVFIIVPLLIFPIVRLIYKTALIHEMVNKLHAADIGFKSTVTTLALFKLKLGNLFILLGTFGLGIPYIMQRNLRFFAKHIQVKGDLDTSKIKQAAGQKPADAEGLHEVLDLDTGLI